jgi:hypothetical protein
MTEQELKDIAAGLKRWHVVSTDTAQKLLDEVYRLRHYIGMESMHMDILYRERDEAIQELEKFKGNNNA